MSLKDPESVGYSGLKMGERGLVPSFGADSLLVQSQTLTGLTSKEQL